MLIQKPDMVWLEAFVSLGRRFRILWFVQGISWACGGFNSLRSTKKLDNDTWLPTQVSSVRVCVCVCVCTRSLRPWALLPLIVSESDDWRVLTEDRFQVLKRPVGMNTSEIIASGWTKATALWKRLQPEPRWWKPPRTMDANGLMRNVKTAIPLNGNCKMKHDGSQQKGKCKLILFLFRCKCLSRLVGIQGLWHQNNLFYYNTRERKAHGALWVTQVAGWNSAIWAPHGLVSTHPTPHLLGREWVRNWNLFKSERIELTVIMDDS